MFDNIGGKIKGLAQFVCWIGIIGSVVIGIILLFLHMIGLGLLIIVFGVLLSWIGSFFTYGFGQLIENSDIIRQTIQNNSLHDCALPEQKTASINDVGAEGNTVSTAMPIKTNPKFNYVVGTCDLCAKEYIGVAKCFVNINKGLQTKKLCQECIEKSNATPAK